MRRRAQRRPSVRDKSNTKNQEQVIVNKTTACLCCLIIVLALIQVYVGLRAHHAAAESLDEEPMRQQFSLVSQQREQLKRSNNQTANYSILPSSTLPAWIQNYLEWHQQERAKFPGNALFDDPDAPKLLIRTCLGLCGGLNDRLGQLPWDLYLANQTGRLLLLHWHRPVALEEFLLPAELNWRVPRTASGFFGSPRVSIQGMQVVRNIKELFQGYEQQEVGPEPVFWETQFDAAMKRATEGEFKDVKVLRHRLLGHLGEDKLEERLRALGETDMLHQSSTYGNIFRMFFRLHPKVQLELENVLSTLRLRPTLQPTDHFLNAHNYDHFSYYSGVHCRVRHPKATPKDVLVKGKHQDHPADKTGLPWEGETRDFAIETATHALQCAKTLAQSKDEPIYFFADSNDLVRFMSHELNDATFMRVNETLLRDPIARNAQEVVQSMHVVARNVQLENAHIDRQKGRDAPSYYGTFIDLYLAMYARCITYGIGYYAILATRISGTQCKLLYTEETWGGDAKKRQTAAMCPLTIQHAKI
ncbi:hypothetical protein MPSEU_000167500 [Mayamaea pseudoterrestris]|nr:hypothetical protein MPSEU_000167500 [Mayamaea pseudoterrestris]